MAKKRMSVDEKSQELANHFLSEVAGATIEDRVDLAEDIQRTCEDFCMALDERRAQQS